MSVNGSVISGISHREVDVGKKIKNSKKRLIWDFEHEGHNHKVEVDLSMMTGKIRITIDSKLFKEFSKKFLGGFKVKEEFKICKASVRIDGKYPKIEMWIDGVPFSEIINANHNEISMQSSASDWDFTDSQKPSISMILLDLQNGEDSYKGNLRRAFTEEQSENYNYFNEIPCFNSDVNFDNTTQSSQRESKFHRRTSVAQSNSYKYENGLQMPTGKLLSNKSEINELESHVLLYKPPIVAAIKEWKCYKLSPYEIKTEEYSLPERTTDTDQRLQLIREIYH